MKIVRLESTQSGEVDLDGARSTVDLSLVDNPQAGEFVIVHAGYAIEKLDTDEADRRISMFEDLARSWKNR